MSIYISGYPTKPDISNDSVIFTVTSSLYTNPQYQFVCDIKDASGTLIQRIKQQPNPNGEGVFNIGQILSSQAYSNVDAIKFLSGSGQPHKIYSATTGSFGKYTVNFGEEYGTSLSSSVTLYNGTTGAAGNPARNKGSNFFIVGGTKDWNTLPDRYSWFSGSGADTDFQQPPLFSDLSSRTITDPKTGKFRDTRHFLCYDAPTDSGAYNSKYYEDNNRTLLTEYPVDLNASTGLTTETSGSRVYKIREHDALTVSWLNGNFDNGQDDLYAQDISGFYITLYPSGKQYWMPNTDTYGGGPRTGEVNAIWAAFSNMSWNNVFGDQTTSTQLITLNLGKHDLQGIYTRDISANDYAYLDLSSTTHAKIQLTGYSNNWIADFNLGAFWVYWDSECNYYDVVRFAWKNTFGVYDWYSANLVSTATTDVTRQQYTQTNVDYSANTVSVFDAQRRGATQYFNGLKRRNTVTTDWLTEEMALYMREMFFSTDVLVQDYENQRMLPVVITNASVTEKTNPRGQKLFNYTIEFEYANNLSARR